MQTFKVPRSSSNLPREVNKLRVDAEEKFKHFCTKMIVDSKLSTKTFNYQFDMCGSRSGGQRKSVQKLKDILLKAVKKQVPYLEYMSGGDILFNNNGSNSVNIKISSPYMMLTIPADSEVSYMLENAHWVKSIRRYFKFMNYKCMRNGISLHMDRIRTTVEGHPEEHAPYKQWTQDRNQKPDFTGRFKITLTAKVSIRGYEHDAYLRHNTIGIEPLPGVDTHEKLAEYWAERDVVGSLQRYRDVSTWGTYDITSRRGLSVYPDSERFMAVEKIFLVLEEMQQVIKTLSRKSNYDTAAFNIGSDSST
jgi:hypothetical protein